MMKAFSYNLDVTEAQINSYKESIDFLRNLSKQFGDTITKFNEFNTMSAGNKSGTEKMQAFKDGLDKLLSEYLDAELENLEKAQQITRSINDIGL